jgi:hypothetical protein
MPVTIEGSCSCGAVSYSVQSNTPTPYMRCYCSVCRKTDGGAGYAINIMGQAHTLTVTGQENLSEYGFARENGAPNPARRSFCRSCGTMLWNFDPTYPDLVHPFASSVDSDLPTPSQSCHIMLSSKANWVTPDIRDGDLTFDEYPDQSIEDWHRTRNLWID